MRKKTTPLFAPSSNARMLALLAALLFFGMSVLEVSHDHPSDQSSHSASECALYHIASADLPTATVSFTLLVLALGLGIIVFISATPGNIYLHSHSPRGPPCNP